MNEFAQRHTIALALCIDIFTYLLILVKGIKGAKISHVGYQTEKKMNVGSAKSKLSSPEV